MKIDINKSLADTSKANEESKLLILKSSGLIHQSRVLIEQTYTIKQITTEIVRKSMETLS